MRNKIKKSLLHTHHPSSVKIKVASHYETFLNIFITNICLKNNKMMILKNKYVTIININSKRTE